MTLWAAPSGMLAGEVSINRPCRGSGIRYPLPQACAWGYTQAPHSGLQEENIASETDSEIQGACAWGYSQTLAKRELRTENIRDEIRTCT